VATFLRRSVMPLLLGVFVSAVAVQSGGAQQAGPPPPPPPPVAGSVPAGMPAPTAEQRALSAAAAIAGAPERLAALEKVRADFPQGAPAFLTQLDTRIIETLVRTPDRTDAALTAVLDRMLARIPASALPEARFTQTATAVAPLITNKVMLDRAEKVLGEAAAALDFEKYFERLRETARTANRAEPARESLETQYNVQYRSRTEYEMGRIHAARGDAARAETAFKAALKLSPASAPPVDALATLYVDRGEKAKAEAFLKDLLKATPPNSGALTSLVSLYEKDNQADKAEALLKDTLKTTPTNTSALNALVNLYDRQKQPQKAEEALKAALKTSNPIAVTLIVSHYEKTNQPEKIEGVLTDALKTTPINTQALNLLLGRYDRENQPAKVETLLNDVVARDGAVPMAWLRLGRIEMQKANDAKALDHFLHAAATQYLRGPDLETLKSLYRKVRGSETGLEAELDKLYMATSKPVTPTAYTPSKARTDRLVLLEMFTGSGCPPCVAADLAFDAVMARYPATAIVPIAYHVHIPQPDPMTTTESEARRLFYSVSGVPTFNIDGQLGKLGGGGWSNTPPVYDEYVTKIDKALELPTEAALSVRATVEGDTVSATATVTKLPAGAKDLRLHILVVERELLFGGENGVREHPMVVRAIAGEKGMGLPLAATGTTQHTFNLATTRDDITKSLAADIARRRGSAPAAAPAPAPAASPAPAAAAPQFAAEGRAMTKIDPAHLVVVAFVQAADKKILQATRSEVVMTPGSSRTPAPQAASSQVPPPAGGAPAPAQPQTPAGPPPPRPEQLALTAAGRIADPATRLTALEKVRTDFPQGINLAQVDQQIFTTLVNTFPDRVDAITTVFDRILGRIAPTATPENRLMQTLTPVTMLVGKKLLLDRSEKLVTDAVAALDFEKYFETQRTVSGRSTGPAPTRAALETQFNTTYRARGHEALARIGLAKGDQECAETEFKNAVKASPSLMTAVNGLVELYTSRGDHALAETVLKNAVSGAAVPAAATPARLALADFYLKRDDVKGAEEQFKEALKATPTSAPANLGLAKIDAKRGNEKGALDRFLEAALTGGVKGADHDTMVALYRKVHGSDTGLEAELDKAYHEKFKNPVKPEAWKATPARSNRLVLLEMFTGSACPPCVSADLALEAVMERYGATIIPLAYHVHIPGPDPMTTSSSETKRLFYGIGGVPTLQIDGSTLVAGGGGPRENTPSTYNRYLPLIEKQLEAPSVGDVNVQATAQGNDVVVTANVSNLPADATGLRLHLVLAERELSFSGENGIRFHPMVVRSVAGDKAEGLPAAAGGSFTHTFKLDAIREDLVNHLAAEIAKRRQTEQPGAAPRAYNAEGRAMTAIDPSQLVVVAYLQGADKKVLQAAQIDVAAGASGAKKK
jgi:Tfp pilus assembly protein PilF/thiol-disulfide isomerase/thioredoxin